MNAPPTQIRYYAASMQLAAYLDGRYVELQVLTDTGEAIAIACDKSSIFAIERHIQQLGRECPEISTWKAIRDDENLRESDESSRDACAAIQINWRN